jgi:hydroxymethylglutaryl-CoA reductase (NADPH)
MLPARRTAVAVARASAAAGPASASRTAAGLGLAHKLRWQQQQCPSQSPSQRPGRRALSTDASLAGVSDEDLIARLHDGDIAQHKLETLLGDYSRAVALRRRYVTEQHGAQVGKGVAGLPHDGMDYASVHGQCCENTVGFVQIPVGTAGPLRIDGREFVVPLATTEGALVASTHRGCKAVTMSGGADSILTENGMTRAPLLRMNDVKQAFELKQWLEKQENFYQVAAAFNSTSRFARLLNIKTNISGRHVYMRFKARTADAMGMNMISKGVEKALEVLQQEFPGLSAMSLSSNFCTDKKPSAVNWIEGRGKSVVCSAVIKKSVVEDTLKTTVAALCEVNTFKNLVGSAMAGSIGGFNAHASNIVTAVYLACGQDPAQNVESSNCLTMMEPTNSGKDNGEEGEEGEEDLLISVTMPSIEVGTVGGGTHLAGQKACLDMLGVAGPSHEKPGAHAEQLARVVAATVLAGELSLMSALTAGHLVKSHLSHNRKAPGEGGSTLETGDVGHSLAGMDADDDE